METALQFGAGNIGRGFMGQLFFEAGYHTVFVDVDTELVDRINGRGSYTLRLLDAYSKKQLEMKIESIEALSTAREVEVAAVFARARIVGTAVGVENLAAIAPLIAAGIRERYGAGALPLDIFLCENSYGAFEILRKAVVSSLEPDIAAWVERNVGFVGTAVARMVPTTRDSFAGADPLLVVSDSYHKLPYDGAASRGGPSTIGCMIPVENFRAEVERKLFTHNLGHAALGYLGYLRGYSYVHETFDDDYVAAVFTGALNETARALLKRYARDLDAAEHAEILQDVRIRFSNPLLKDTVQRVGRDPIRKLGPEDRLIGSARLCLEEGVFPEKIALVCAAALCYDYPADPAAVQLQELIVRDGVEETLRRLSGVEPSSDFGAAILSQYQSLCAQRATWSSRRRTQR